MMQDEMLIDNWS